MCLCLLGCCVGHLAWVLLLLGNCRTHAHTTHAQRHTWQKLQSMIDTVQHHGTAQHSLAVKRVERKSRLHCSHHSCPNSSPVTLPANWARHKQLISSFVEAKHNSIVTKLPVEQLTPLAYVLISWLVLDKREPAAVRVVISLHSLHVAITSSRAAADISEWATVLA